MVGLVGLLVERVVGWLGGWVGGVVDQVGWVAWVGDCLTGWLAGLVAVWLAGLVG